MRRLFLLLLIAFSAAPLVAAPGDPIVSRIAFGSCCKESQPAPIFDAINAYQPDVWVWMGDNIYGDSADVEVLRKKWTRQKARPGYAKLREETTVIGTWDDHDYGKNDAGQEFTSKAESQQAFLDFLDVDRDDPRREREGVYTSHLFGPEGKQVKVILLDTRYHRGRPRTDEDILGEAQWKWLEQELHTSKAQVHLLVSSIQAVPEEHPYEKWHNFPKAIARLYALLSREDIPPVTILSGDRHRAEISVEKSATPYPVYDVTSSSLNEPISRNRDEKNSRRVGNNFAGANFGTLEIDWSATPPNLDFTIRDEKGRSALWLTNITQAR